MQYKDCPTCDGTGVEIYEIESGGYYNSGNMPTPYVDIIEKQRECEGCNGHGRIIISPLEEEEDV